MKSKVVWTVSQDGGLEICGGYCGKDARRKAMLESGGKSRRMTYAEFKEKYPRLDVVCFEGR